jgi:hypothetical protein
MRKQMRGAAAVVREAEAESEPVPEPSAPDASDATVGTDTAQSMVARYLPSCVQLFAGVAFGKGSEAKLRSRAIAAGHLVKIAGGMAEEVPEPDEG